MSCLEINFTSFAKLSCL